MKPTYKMRNTLFLNAATARAESNAGIADSSKADALSSLASQRKKLEEGLTRTKNARASERFAKAIDQRVDALSQFVDPPSPTGQDGTVIVRTVGVGKNRDDRVALFPLEGLMVRLLTGEESLEQKTDLLGHVRFDIPREAWDKYKIEVLATDGSRVGVDSGAFKKGALSAAHLIELAPSGPLQPQFARTEVWNKAAKAAAEHAELLKKVIDKGLSKQEVVLAEALKAIDERINKIGPAAPRKTSAESVSAQTLRRHRSKRSKLTRDDL